MLPEVNLQSDSVFVPKYFDFDTFLRHLNGGFLAEETYEKVTLSTRRVHHPSNALLLRLVRGRNRSILESQIHYIFSSKTEDSSLECDFLGCFLFEVGELGPDKDKIPYERLRLSMGPLELSCGLTLPKFRYFMHAERAYCRGIKPETREDHFLTSRKPFNDNGVIDHFLTIPKALRKSTVRWL